VTFPHTFFRSPPFFDDLKEPDIGYEPMLGFPWDFDIDSKEPVPVIHLPAEDNPLTPSNLESGNKSNDKSNNGGTKGFSKEEEELLKTLEEELEWCKKTLNRDKFKRPEPRPDDYQPSDRVRDIFDSNDPYHSPPNLENDPNSWLNSLKRRQRDFIKWEEELGGNDWGHREQMRQKCREIEKRISQLISQKKAEERKQNSEFQDFDLNLPPIIPRILDWFKDSWNPV
jgi:hypothetical protein